MKSAFILASILISSLAFAHEGGHGTPEDPIANLPRLTIKGKSYGVDGMIKGDKLVVSFHDAETGNAVSDLSAEGFPGSVSADTTFKGATKATKSELKLAGNSYQGTLKGTGKSPTIKLALTPKGGKKQTVVMENIQQEVGSESGHSHDASKPHSHGTGAPHTH